MKKIIPLAISFLFVLWSVFLMIVTPWGALSGKLVFNTTRVSLSEKETMSTMVTENNQNRVILKGEGLYKYRWSPDGTKIAAFSGSEIVLIDEQGSVLQSIERDGDMLGGDMVWFPDGQRILTIEHLRSSVLGKGYEPGYLFIYDVVSGKREDFYIKNDYVFHSLAVSKSGTVFFTGNPANPEALGKGYGLYKLNPLTKEIILLARGPRLIELTNDDKKIVFSGSLRIFGKLISPRVLGVYDLKTGFTRYASLWAGDIRQMTTVENGKYLITAEGEGTAVMLYKRSLLGGFKLPIMKSEKLAHLNGSLSQDQYPDWHA